MEAMHILNFERQITTGLMELVKERVRRGGGMSRNYSSRINQPLKLQLVFREEMLSLCFSFPQKENKSFMLLLITPV